MMNVVRKALKRIKLLLAVSALIAVSLFSYSFGDAYFEISKNLDIFSSLYRELNLYYVDETNPGELMKTGIDAMLKSLDPYTNYIPESDIEDYRFMTTGAYGGIGALIRRRDENVLIAEPYENFPAQKAGLRAGDLILEIDGKSARNKSTEEMSTVLKGTANTKVKLLIERPGESAPLEMEITREEIKIKDVPHYEMLDDKTGYIKLTGFHESASAEIDAAFEEMKTNGMESLVLDLRGNGGGLLQQAVRIVNFFVDKGEPIVSTKGKVKNWHKVHKATSAPLDVTMPIVVLIDGGSASASEIVAGALQDLDRAVLVGDITFGKGLVQQTVNLSYNSKLKITVAKYYIPSGRCVQRLNYADRDAGGRAKVIPDSLITEYTTKNGRLVYDGAGITPDISVEAEEVSNIIRGLVSDYLIFDYATQFRLEHASIAEPKEFTISDEEYDNFKKFLKEQEYVFSSNSEDMLDALEKTAEGENYLKSVEAEMEALRQKLIASKGDDITRYQKQIKNVLANEIISRYYYQNGRIKSSLSIDPDVKKALEVLHDRSLYNSVLDGSFAQKNKPDSNSN